MRQAREEGLSTRKATADGGATPSRSPMITLSPCSGSGWSISNGFALGPRFATRISRSEEHTSELQSLMRNSYAAFFLKKYNSYTHSPHPLLTPPHALLKQ